MDEQMINEVFNSSEFREFVDKIANIIQPQGEWKLDSLGVYCSECVTHPDYSSNYCPNCGAKMT